MEEDDKRSGVLKSKVKRAIKEIRRKKVTADDDITVDLFKELGNKRLKKLTKPVKQIYRTGQITSWMLQ